jgi:hypothetical protein
MLEEKVKDKMGKFNWVIWGLLFSVVLFLSIYFLVYVKLTGNAEPVQLMLGNLDVSKLSVFFSKISNVVITSFVIGFLLGSITAIKSRND